MKAILFSLLIVFTCCFSKEQTKSSAQYYSDIDMFNLKGINELLFSELKYPYVEIDSISSVQKEIAFHFDGKTVYRRIYEKNDSGWNCSYIVKGEDGVSYFFEYLLKDKILSLEYSGDPNDNAYVRNIRVLEQGKEQVYDFADGKLSAKPSANIATFQLEKCFRREVSTFVISNGVLKITTNYSYAPDEMLRGKTIENCYVLGSLSYFWWSFIGYRLEKVEC